MQEQFSLKTYNSFGFDVKAKHFVEIQSVSELEDLISSGILETEKHLILSGGNNVLFCDNYFDGIVVYMNIKGINFRADTNIETLHATSLQDGTQNYAIVRAYAGEDWPDFVQFTVENNLHGLENLAHIPGKVGAAPVQNIGAYGAELKDCFLQCEAICLATGEHRVFKKDECKFAYRNSIFKSELKGKYVIVSVDFLLKRNAKLNLEYGNIKNYLTENKIDTPTLQQLHDAICAIRDAKLPDVRKIGNAGSFFKNPVIEKAQFEALQKAYPDAPHYAEPDGKVKVPAGWLIEKAGWKGWRDEHVGVYEKQALVLVHYGGGNGCDIVELAKKIIQSVKEKFGIEISPEVNFISN